MRIAFIVGEFPCLSETFVLNQISGLIERGHAVDIHADPSSQVNASVATELRARAIYRPQMPRNLVVRALKALGLILRHGFKGPAAVLGALNVWKRGREAASLRLLYALIPLLGRRLCYDIIHCQFGPNGSLGEFLRDTGLLNGKLIVTLHGSDMSAHLRKVGERSYDRLFARADLLLPVSQRWKQRLVELGCPKSKIRIHRMGIDCRIFSRRSRKRLAGTPIRLASVGRLVEKKGIGYGIRAVAQLVRQNYRIDYSVIGDGPLRPDLERLIQKLALTDHVRLLGWKSPDEIIEVLGEADILIAPSVVAQDGDEEGIPVVIMEAMALGLPVVATQHGGIPELVAQGTCGYLVPERDTEALVVQLSQLLAGRDDWDRLGQAGRAIVERRHDINRLNDELVELYQGVLAGTLNQSTVNEAPPA